MSSASLTVLATTLLSSSAFGALVAGDIAIVGFQALGAGSDSISFVSLVELAGGTTLYFTDNGWTGTAFRGVSATDGDGNENLMRWTSVNTIAAGTIIGSKSTSADYVWTTTGLVGAGTAAYAQLSLSSTGDQVTVLEGTVATNPLFSGFTSLYNFDNTTAYENATSSGTGSLAPGLARGTTAVLLNNAMNSAQFNISALTSGTREDWLVAIGNSANWMIGTDTADSPSGSILVVPAPGTLALIACATLLARRRR